MEKLRIVETKNIWYFSLIMVTTSVGIIVPVLKNNGEIHIDSDKTFFRNLDNTDIALNEMDFVRVVK